MIVPGKLSMFATVLSFGLCAVMPFESELRSTQSGQADPQESPDPWSNAQVLHAADLASELGNRKGPDTPTIIYVGFRTLFEGGHIPGASFQGTTSKENGLADLKKWVASLPRSRNLVIYCGCCPFDKCPNVRPAYKALHEMGFTHVRVLVLPTSFAADWVEKAYPLQRGL